MIDRATRIKQRRRLLTLIRALSAIFVGVGFCWGWMTAGGLEHARAQEPQSRRGAPVRPEAGLQPQKAPAAIPVADDFAPQGPAGPVHGSRIPAQPAGVDPFPNEAPAVGAITAGLKLIGTVVGEPPHLSYAVIEVATMRGQAIFREKDSLQGVVIRKILRNAVIVEIEGGGLARLAAGEGGGAQPLARGMPPEFPENPVAVEIPLDEVAAALADPLSVVRELIITPRVNEGQIAGFSIGRLRAHDILFRIGLRTGDVITGVDGKTFTSADGALDLFQRLLEGGEVSVQIERRGRPQRLQANINPG